MANREQQEININNLIKQREALEIRIAKLYEQKLGGSKETNKIKKQLLDIEGKITKETEKQTGQQKKIQTIQKDLTADINKLTKLKRRQNGIEKNMFGFTKLRIGAAADELQILAERNKRNEINNNLAKDLRESLQEIGEGQLDINGLKSQAADLQAILKDESKELTDEEKKRINNTLRLNTLEQKRLGITNSITNAVSQSDKVFGGMGSTIKNFLTNPLTGAVAILAMFGAQQKAIADNFGSIGVTEFRKELASAQQSFTLLTLTGTDSFKAISTLSNEFGVGFTQATKMAAAVGEISLTTALSVDNAAKLVGLFTRTQGLTTKQASNLIKSTQALAKANNVAPDLVLEDIAKNTEFFAKFAKDGGENLLRAAVQARKLGISLDSVSKTAEGLLNFQDSLNKEIEASILLGRNVDLTRARELSFLNDIEGLQTEILNVVGSQTEFNNMNLFQRKALAAALNMEASELQKIVGRQKEAVSLQGELANQDLSNMIPEKTITAVAKLISEFKVLGMQLAEDIGKPLMEVVKTFGNFIGHIDKTIGLTTLLGLSLGIMAGKMVYATTQTFVLAAAHLGLMTAKISSFTMGLGTIAAIATGAMVMSSMKSMTSQASSLGPGLETGTQLGGVKNDTVQALHKGETILNKNDTAMLSTILGASSGGRGTDTKKLERQNQEMNDRLDKLTANMESYFGAGGSAIKGIGRNLGETILTA